MNQANRLNNLRILATEQNGRLFRNNVGEAWNGIEYWDTENQKRVLKLSSPRRIKFGLIEGSSDLIGWKRVKITPEMIGQEIAVFWAMEEKANYDKLSDEQLTFLSVVNANGGISEIAIHKKNKVTIMSLVDYTEKERKDGN